MQPLFILRQWFETEVAGNVAGGIPCHQWNIHIDGLWSVFRAKSQNNEKSNTELELFELQEMEYDEANFTTS